MRCSRCGQPFTPTGRIPFTHDETIKCIEALKARVKLLEDIIEAHGPELIGTKEEMGRIDSAMGWKSAP